MTLNNMSFDILEQMDFKLVWKQLLFQRWLKSKITFYAHENLSEFQYKRISTVA